MQVRAVDQWFDAIKGFQISGPCAVVRDARGGQHRGECLRPRAIGRGGGRSERPAEACLAGAESFLTTAEGCGTGEIMAAQAAGRSGSCPRGVAGLLRDKTRKPGLSPLPLA